MSAETSYLDQIIDVIKQFDAEKQRRVLDFVTHIDRRKRVSGKEFLARTEHLHIDPEDLKLMEQAIEEDCERIDPEDDIEFPA